MMTTNVGREKISGMRYKTTSNVHVEGGRETSSSFRCARLRFKVILSDNQHKLHHFNPIEQFTCQSHLADAFDNTNLIEFKTWLKLPQLKFFRNLIGDCVGVGFGVVDTLSGSAH